MDAVTAISNDHRIIEALFDKLEHDEGDRAALVAEVKARLSAHNHAEEERVYPAIKRKDPDEAEEVDHAIEEHREGEQKLAALESAGDDDFSQALEELVSAVKHHVEEEESEVLPALKEAVSGSELDRLGREFEETRLAELSEQGIDDSLTKEQLYQKAADADIPGRSSMSKDELAQALRSQSGG